MLQSFVAPVIILAVSNELLLVVFFFFHSFFFFFFGEGAGLGGVLWSRSFIHYMHLLYVNGINLKKKTTFSENSNFSTK